MVEYCEIFQHDIFENSRFFAWAENSLKNSHKVKVMIEKVRTGIGCYFLSPDFKSREQSRYDSYRMNLRVAAPSNVYNTFESGIIIT